MRTDLRELAPLLALVALLIAPRAAVAGSGSLPPDVDLDPDRGMSFGRLPKTSFDRRASDPLKNALDSRAMDPSIDPWNPVVRPSRYEPGTGKIRDSYSDKVRELRRDNEARRNTRLVQREDEKSARKSARPPTK
ncbi:MAG: hypothetical protein FJ148_00645 [Deltaproteobacteria bacterium]|nr:hypothetical protein [Deltaproteobacteria bacterium]